MQTCDAIIIGGGQAGPPLAKRLAGAGQRVAIIERKAFGGTCINTGCTPTKTLVASAYAAHMARRAAEFGVVVAGGVSVDMRRVKQRKDAIVASWSAATEASLRATENCTVYRGHARFIGPHEVEVGGERLVAERIFIDVGGRASVPAIPGVDSVPYLTNTTALALEVVPEHLLVLGGSYVGLEFAQIFRRFGAEVTVLEGAPRLVHARGRRNLRSDPRLPGERRRAHRLRCPRSCRVGHATWCQDQSDGRRRARLDRGVASVAGGRAAAEHRRSRARSGRRCGRRAWLSSRWMISCGPTCPVSGRSATAMAGARSRTRPTTTSRSSPPTCWMARRGRCSDRVAAYALYTDPPLGRAGMTEAQARQSGRNVLVASMAMADVARAIEKSETAGMMKLVADAETGKILGAAVLGTGGDEVIHSVLDLMYADAPYTVLRRAMHIHPTVAEMLPSLAAELAPAGVRVPQQE